MDYDNFIGSTSIVKTLRNELIPTDYTRQHIKKNGILSMDELRAEKSRDLKKLMNDFYRTYIDEKMSGIHDLEWDEVFNAISALMAGEKTVDNSSKLENVMGRMREKINVILKDDENFDDIFSASLITKILPKFIENNKEYSQEQKGQYYDTVQLFSKFASSLTDFFDSRENIFSDEAIHGSICNRVVNENTLIFYQNIISYQNILKNASEEVKKIESENEDYFNGWQLSHIYSYDFYNNVLTQSGIDFYNEVCSRVNLHINLYCQQSKDKTAQYRMRKLRKMILSNVMTGFEVQHMYESDNEVYNSLNDFVKKMKDGEFETKLERMIEKSLQYNYDEIYVAAKNYSNISVFISGEWDCLINCIAREYNKNTASNADDKAKKEKYRSLKRIYNVVTNYGECDELRSTKEHEYLQELEKIYDKSKMHVFESNDKTKLIDNDTKIEQIKEMLDMLLNVSRFLDTFYVPDDENVDMGFYGEIEELVDILNGVVSLYNRVRNYVTQKPYSEKKILLSFNSPTLADGWSKSKEYDNNAIILRKEGKYYLAIFNVKNKPDKRVMEGSTEKKGECYEKMVYNYLPGANKMLPKVCLSKKGKDNYKPSEYIIDGYKKKKHVKSCKEFDIKFCHDLIDYFKACINAKKDWKTFDFNFSNTEEYDDISGFYNEISEQGYKVSWVNIPKEDIERLNREGQIYLFQIYNKDFSDKSTGTPNLHTMYFKNIFSEENMREEVIMLNGGAELFFRKASIENKIEHKEGTVLVNKTYKEMIGGEEVRVPVPEKEYVEIYTYLNNGKSTKLSDSAQKLFDSGKIEYREAKKNITKDRRYTEDKFFLHIPITLNYKVTKNNIRLNEQVLDYISEQKNLHIIGIDRGERNLIYVSVIDMNGRIVKQKSYNIVSGYDYQKKLVEREIARDDARKSWKEVGKITDLKEGYLSQVVHEISQMVLEYNAVIAMEELNYGFKRGRFKVERQVYQKFETMLISKLNYLVDKKKKVDEPGGVLKGYQLTYVPEKVTDVGKQCGIIFYVPPAYTSKIDPTTGFVDLFDFKADKPRKFLSRFDSIRYVKAGEEQDMFAFSFDYDNFAIHNTTPVIKKWIAYTYGSRIKKKPDIKNGKRVYSYEKLELTDEMKKLLNQNEISYGDGHNIVDDIKALDDKEKEALTDGIFNLFRLTVQLRNSMSEAEDYDMIVSPIRNDSGEFFDSSKYKNDDFGKESVDMPKDADANGAYCIAMKCLFEMKKVQQGWSKSDKKNFDFLTVTNEDWFDFMQNKMYL